MPRFFRQNRRFPLDRDTILPGWKLKTGGAIYIHRFLFHFIPRLARIFSHWSRDDARNASSLCCGNHYRRELAQSTYTWVTLPSANRRIAMHTSMRMRPASPCETRLLEYFETNRRAPAKKRRKRTVCRSRSTCRDFADSSRESKEEIQVTIFALMFFFLF